MNCTQNTSNSSLLGTWFWGPYGIGATRVLAMCTHNADKSVSSTRYVAHDLLKSVSALFDSTGTRQAKFEYTLYGETLTSEGAWAAAMPLCHSSEYCDEDLDLIYYNYRHYNPQDGRWISRDSIWEKGGINLYAFVDNHVSQCIDMWGNAKRPAPRSPQGGIVPPQNRPRPDVPEPFVPKNIPMELKPNPVTGIPQPANLNGVGKTTIGSGGAAGVIGVVGELQSVNNGIRNLQFAMQLRKFVGLLCCQAKQKYLENRDSPQFSEGCCVIEIVYYQARIPQTRDEYVPTGKFEPLKINYIRRPCNGIASFRGPLPSMKNRITLKITY